MGAPDPWIVHHGILPKMARVAIESHEAVAMYGAYQAKTIWCYDCRFSEYGRKNVMVRQYKCNIDIIF